MIGIFSRIITQMASHSSSFFASFYGDYLSASGYNFIVNSPSILMII